MSTGIKIGIIAVLIIGAVIAIYFLLRQQTAAPTAQLHYDANGNIIEENLGKNMS